MRAELVTDLGAAEAFEEEWRQLATATGNAFLTPEWSLAWFQGCGRDQTPAIVIARRGGGELAGVVPLAIPAAGRPRALRFAGASLGDHFGIAATPDDEVPVAAAAMALLEQQADLPAMIVLHRVDLDRDWPERMASVSRRRLAVVEQSRTELPHVSVEGMNWEGYLAGRSQKFRQRIARGLERALEREGVSYSVRETTDPAAIDADMSTLFRLHDLRHPGGSSISSPEVRGFLTEFARAALARGWLRLRVLELEGDPAAAYLAWRVGSRYAVYQSGFDPSWAEQQAGMLLLNDTVRSAIGEQVDDVDLLLGGEAFKWRFAPEPRHVHTVVLVGALRPSRLLVSAEAALRRHGRGLASRRVIGPLARALARILPSGR